MKGDILQTEHGSVLTMPEGEAMRVRPRIEEALDAVVQVERVPEFPEDNDYRCFRIAPLHREAQFVFHHRVRLYIKAWSQGQQDALDSHYQRPAYLAYLAEANAPGEGDGLVEKRGGPGWSPQATITAAMKAALKAASEDGLGSWEAAPGVLGALKRRGWVEQKNVFGERTLKGEPRYFVTAAGSAALKGAS